MPDIRRLVELIQDALADAGSFAWLAIYLLFAIGLWKMFEKAGKPGWLALIPIINVIFLVDIAGRPLWWCIFLLIPCINLIVWIVLMLDVARRYGKGPLFALGMIFFGPIFFMILGFGRAEYR